MASALVPLLLALFGTNATFVLLVVFLCVLIMSFIFVYDFEALAPSASGIAWVELAGLSLLVVEFLDLKTKNRNIMGAVLAGRVLRLVVFSRHLVLSVMVWSKDTPEKREATTSAVSTRVFDYTATRGGAFLAAASGLTYALGPDPSSSSSSGGSGKWLLELVLLGVVASGMAVSARVVEAKLLNPVLELLWLLAPATQDALGLLDRHPGATPPGEGNLGGPGGGPGGGGSDLGAPISAHLAGAAGLPGWKQASGSDLLNYCVGQLAHALARTMTTQEALAMDEAESQAEERAEATVKQVPSFDDRVDPATWCPVSTLGDPMVELRPKHLSNSDENFHLEFTIESAKGKWTWDMIQLKQRDQVYGAVYHVFQAEGLLDHFKLPRSNFKLFIREIGSRYLPNPYHNPWHGADVCFTTWRYIRESDSTDWMTRIEVLAALLAAYGHDVGHPGVNNPFLVQTSSDLALLHNDHSPLENMHSAILAGLLRDTRCIESLSGGDQRSARAIMISSILGTDMIHHFSQISDLRVFYEANGCLMPSYGGTAASASMVSDDVKRRFIIDMFVHMADVSNPAKEWAAAKKWSFLVLEEFWSQGDKERELGMQVAPMYDRRAGNVAMTQVNFAEYLVFPLLLVLTEIFPSLEPVARFLTANVANWSELRAREIEAEHSKAALKAQGHGSMAASSASELPPLPPAVESEVKELRKRGPELDIVLTNALKSLIVRSTGTL